MNSSQRGQSLIELVVGIGIGVLFITAAIGIITVSLRLDFQNKFSQTAGELTQETLEQVATFANADWHNVDLLSRDVPLHLDKSAGFLTFNTGSSTADVIDGVTYTTSFSIQDVCRNSLDEFGDCATYPLDPSTLKITAATQWQQNDKVPEIRLTHYITRVRDRLWFQNDWSSGSSSLPFQSFNQSTMNQGWFTDATNTQWTAANQLTILDTTKNLKNTAGNGIDVVYRYAWNDVVGWFDFRINNNVFVGSTLTGWASHINGVVGLPTLGDLALDCSSTPGGNNICATSNFVIAKSTGGTAAGVFSGYAWNDSIGWVSFNCDHTTDPIPGTNDCATLGSNPTGAADYYVSIDSSGVFWGWAWNDIIGWISFNCDHSGDSYGQNNCGTSTYSVKTGASQVSWGELTSLPFDTQRTNGAGYNTIMWDGSLPLDTHVKFQIDSADAAIAGPWNFVGPDGTANSYYQPTGPGVQLRINRANFNNKRYVVYRIILESDPGLTKTPTVNDVIINWSH